MEVSLVAKCNATKYFYPCQIYDDKLIEEIFDHRGGSFVCICIGDDFYDYLSQSSKLSHLD